MKNPSIVTGKMKMWPSCAIGVGIGIAAGFALVAVGAACILNEYLSREHTDIISAAIQFLAAFLGCVVAGSMTADDRIAYCAVTAGALLLLFMCAGIMLFDGISGGFLMGVVAVLFGFAASVFIVVNKRKRPMRRTIKRRSR